MIKRITFSIVIVAAVILIPLLLGYTGDYLWSSKRTFPWYVLWMGRIIICTLLAFAAFFIKMAVDLIIDWYHWIRNEEK